MVFDLDPCSPVVRPFSTARHHYTIEDDGLTKRWFGRVFLNPPYGPATKVWLQKLVLHGNGIALVFARTETQWFYDLAWTSADGILFLKRRIKFFDVRGRQGGTAPAPSCLIAFGKDNLQALSKSRLPGSLVTGWTRLNGESGTANYKSRMQ